MKQPDQIRGYKVDRSTLISLEKGKIPPQALDLEEVVLGAMMIDKKGVDEVIDTLTGVTCGNKPTSCPDQIACALKAYRG